MAKQIGPIRVTGTVQNLCFYKMEGKYYVRAKSSLNGKRVKKDKAFKQTMAYANLLARASKIAAAFYRKLTKEERGLKIYRELTGKVMQELKKIDSEKM
jgi:hypothetical protein